MDTENEITRIFHVSERLDVHERASSVIIDESSAEDAVKRLQKKAKKFGMEIEERFPEVKLLQVMSRGPIISVSMPEEEDVEEIIEEIENEFGCFLIEVLTPDELDRRTRRFH